MTTEEILLTIIKDKGSCDKICENNRVYCHNCIYIIYVDGDKENSYCKYLDDPDDIVYEQALKDFLTIYKDEIKLFEALL